MAETRSEGRRRGRIEKRGNTLRVIVYAGLDPVTGKRTYKREKIEGTDDKARKKANRRLTKLAADVDSQRTPAASVTLAYVLDEWLRTTEIETSTRHGYVGYIERTIKPALGKVRITKLGARDLESLYTNLRRCSKLCDQKPYIERHKKRDDHDCVEEKCVPHKCNPASSSTVRQIHSIISGALNAAVRWDWLAANPAKVAQRPKQKPPEPKPPTPDEAARLIKKAFDLDEDWGKLVWLVMTTGMRRAEVAALRWRDVDLGAEVVEIRRSYVRTEGEGVEKDTKTHQMRRLALDSETVTLLRGHKKRVEQRCKELHTPWSDDLFVFSGNKIPDHTKPYPPDAISRRYKRMATGLGIKTHIHSLRHYSATELLTAGIDLRTVAGRLGHGGGGATTLRVYAAWVAASDRKAAELLGSRMPKL